MVLAEAGLVSRQPPSNVQSRKEGAGQDSTLPAAARRCRKDLEAVLTAQESRDGQILFEVYIDLQKGCIIVWRVVSDVADNSNHNNNIGL